jgi:hypothetical protein
MSGGRPAGICSVCYTDVDFVPCGSGIYKCPACGASGSIGTEGGAVNV